MSIPNYSTEHRQEFPVPKWPAYLFFAMSPIAIVLAVCGLIFSASLPGHPVAERYGEYAWIVLGTLFLLFGFYCLNQAKTIYVVTHDSLIVERDSSVVRRILKSQIISAEATSTKGGPIVNVVIQPDEKLQIMCENYNELARLLQPRQESPAILWGNSEE